MRGFRNAFNITFTDQTVEVANLTDSATTQCASNDDVETSALVVRSILNIIHHWIINMIFITEGAIVSVFSIGALAGALLSGLLSDLAGRKITLIVGASSSAIGATLQTSSLYLWYKVLQVAHERR